MELVRFRIKNFRAIIDTDWIECERITAFVGANESGKTSILMALMKLMDASVDSRAGNTLHSNIGKLAKISLKYDLPIDRAEELMEGVDNLVFIEAVFTADTALNERLADLCKNKFRTVKEIYISKTYGGNYHLDIFDQFDKEAHPEVLSTVLQKLPVFLYYKEVTEIASEINLVTLAEKIAGYKKSQLTLREVIYNNLLNYLDIWKSNLVKSIKQVYGEFDTDEVSASVDFCRLFEEIPLFKQRFDRGFVRLNEEFKKWWGQSGLAISYEVYKKGVRIIVVDHDNKAYLLQNRSTGFRRFFSLFLSFAVSAKQDFENAIMLFDEAGAALHPITQIKLADYFIVLSKYCQVMYNTHTSYMLPTTEMNRARIVYKDFSGHTKISPVLTVMQDKSNEESLFAAQASLAMHLAGTSLVGVFPIAVLNYHDMYYLQVIRDILIANGLLNTFFDTLIFTGGVNGIDANTEIFSAGDEPPVVLLSSDAEGRMIKDRLQQKVYKNYRHKIVEVSDFMRDATTFEDLLPPKLVSIFLDDYFKRTMGVGFKYDVKRKLSLTAQIEEFAAKRGVTLPEGYRSEMAKSLKLSIRDRYVDQKIPDEYATVWKKIMRRLLRD